MSAIAQGILPFRLADDFANRAVIFGPNYWIVGSLSNATTEPDEPLIDGVSSGQTMWGTWTAPSNGTVTLSADTETFSPLLTVYAGNDFAGLSLVASNNYLMCFEHGPCGCHWRERNQTTFHVASGQAYQICVDSAIITDAAMELVPIPGSGGPFQALEWEPVFTTNVFEGGDFILNLEFSPAPPNDDFVNRVKLSGSRFSTHASNAGATKELGEPNHLGNPGGSSVWYSWTAPASGRITLSTNEVPAYSPPSPPGGGGVITTRRPYPPTCGNEVDQNPPPVFYPILAVYTGNAVNSLTSADCLPAALDAYPNMVEFDAVKGQTYQIAFDGNLGTTGDIPLYLALTTPPSNDNSQHSITLHGVSVTATGYNAGATHQAGEPILLEEPVLNEFSSGKDVWWSWTAPIGGPVSIDLSSSDYPFPVGVFTVVTVGGLSITEWVARGSGRLSFDAIQGRTYQIAVGDYNGLTGQIGLNLHASIVDLPLYRVAGRDRVATLIYTASAGEVVALLYSSDNENWEIVQTKIASGKMVFFQARPAPTPSGPFYRAILFDRTGSSRHSHSANDSFASDLRP
ncbi:MAG: hypothetical protein ABSA45_03905 [Verrucomicrobiota bacterium]